MATSGTQKVFGGTPSVRNSDPKVSGSANSLGLYAWSAFRARLGTGSATSFTPDTTGYLAGVTVELLLFTSDVLAVGDLLINNAAAAPDDVAITTDVSVSFFDATSGGSDLVVPVGSVGQGYVGTVACSGFPASALLLVTAIAGESIDAKIVCNSPNISSPVGRSYPATPATTSGAVPVILASSSYTAAIRDAANLITASGITYQVVGLYKVVTRA
jgi:hypothetical protein